MSFPDLLPIFEIFRLAIDILVHTVFRACLFNTTVCQFFVIGEISLIVFDFFVEFGLGLFVTIEIDGLVFLVGEDPTFELHILPYFRLDKSLLFKEGNEGLVDGFELGILGGLFMELFSHLLDK